MKYSTTCKLFYTKLLRLTETVKRTRANFSAEIHPSPPQLIPLISRPTEKKNLRVQRNPPLLFSFEKLGAKGGETGVFSPAGAMARRTYRA